MEVGGRSAYPLSFCRHVSRRIRPAPPLLFASSLLIWIDMDAEDEPTLSGKTPIAHKSKSKPLPKFPSKTCKYAGVTFRELLKSSAFLLFCLLHHIRDGDREHSTLFCVFPINKATLATSFRLGSTRATRNSTWASLTSPPMPRWRTM